jgi:hypothetical protein
MINKTLKRRVKTTKSKINKVIAVPTLQSRKIQVSYVHSCTKMSFVLRARRPDVCAINRAASLQNLAMTNRHVHGSLLGYDAVKTSHLI